MYHSWEHTQRDLNPQTTEIPAQPHLLNIDYQYSRYGIRLDFPEEMNKENTHTMKFHSALTVCSLQEN